MDRIFRRNASGQLGALCGTFLARFFENEITGGSNGLKASFFWLVALLAAPGFFIGVMLSFQWDLTSRLHGAAALRASALSSKLVYLSYGMVVSGLLAAITWSSLLLDRRDALIIGVLPVRPATVVAGKLLALSLYLGLLTAALNGPAALSIGVALAAGSHFRFALRGIAAHLVAGGMGCTFLFLAVTSAQGLALALTGPGAFKRVSSMLQLVVIGGVVIGFLLQPLFAISTRDTIAGVGVHNRPWMLHLPPFWFLGTYEWVLGTSNPVLTSLHWRGMAAFSLLLVVTAVSYLVSYARLSRAVVEGADAAPPRPGAAACVEWLVGGLTRHPASRAAAQFFVTSMARVERLRFIAAMTIGLVVGWSVPLVYLWWAELADPSENVVDPMMTTSILSLSLADLAFLVTGLRVAAAMPSDLKASWIIPMIEARGTRLRSGVWRALFALGVVPIVVLFAPLLAWFWGGMVAISHSMVLLATGALLVEVLLWNAEQMPNASPWRPERLQLGKRWPLYLLGFILFSTGIAGIEALVFGRPVLVVGLVALLVMLIVAVRVAHRRRLIVPEDDPEDVGAPAVLRIS
ncbi:MAG: hypothetical protein ABI051_16325 [Vicinamibacterales bacterium]